MLFRSARPRPRCFWRPPDPSSGSVRGPSGVSAGAALRPLYGLPPAGGLVAPLPQPLPSAPALPPAPWDPALLAALHTAPTPQQYTDGGDWYMDTGATAHMAANPGNPLTAHPVHTAARITVGDGSSMPITHVGHAAFPSNSVPLHLSNVLVSPDIIKNLISVRSLTRENPITVEFDMFGFSVKDARTRMVLHRCDSPDDLYSVHSSTSSIAAPWRFPLEWTFGMLVLVLPTLPPFIIFFVVFHSRVIRSTITLVMLVISANILVYPLALPRMLLHTHLS